MIFLLLGPYDLLWKHVPALLLLTRYMVLPVGKAANYGFECIGSPNKPCPSSLFSFYVVKIMLSYQKTEHPTLALHSRERIGTTSIAGAFCTF